MCVSVCGGGGVVLCCRLFKVIDVLGKRAGIVGRGCDSSTTNARGN